ncbi:uncharacterized protein N7503_006911 [Penicillium pulvis]|uniref:uncharacterized protein n=1 Tax=Penicillium pulvis TaxID=1562058 RepID=UPI00254821F8|nr:uncharacterized protein N7503_006911 [Penicillium pulvis]KAJ5797615.1 hypothetical protein N7503_006911 [Penicillium pulvis]
MAARPPTFRLFWHRFAGPSARNSCQADFAPTWRSFVTSAPRSARGQAKPSSRNVVPGSSVPVGSIGRLALKVAREGDVVLFKAPSHRTYVMSAYGLSAFCFAYALFNSNDVFRDAQIERPVWQKGLFGGICVTMSVMGTLFLVRTGHLVRSITAVKSNNQTYIRFSVRRMVPFTKPYQIEVLPSEVSISRRLVISQDSKQRFEGDSKKIGSAQDPQPGFFKAPVQTMSVGIWKMFMSMRQIFTGEDFILMKVEGRKQTFRVDSNGFVSNDFMALGNPVQFKRS